MTDKAKIEEARAHLDQSQGSSLPETAPPAEAAAPAAAQTSGRLAIARFRPME
jgi:hypothetical protein